LFLMGGGHSSIRFTRIHFITLADAAVWSKYSGKVYPAPVEMCDVWVCIMV
jgi:hypothetical protein